MKFENGLFIFRRDFRIIDNTGLNLAHSKCKNIFGCFIFTPEQVGQGNPYKSNNAVQFMIESLENLNTHMGNKLMTLYGSNKKIIYELIKSCKIDYICFNKDYSPYALERDEEIVELCKKMGVTCEITPDYYLHEPGTIFSGSKTPYQKFTPFYNACINKHVQPVAPARSIHFSNKNIEHSISLKTAMSRFTKQNPDILVHGGRENAIKTLDIAKKTQKHYSSNHNDLDKNTTQLSAYIKFGCVSIREVYFAFKSRAYHDIVRQLIWRDFYMNILYAYPHVLGKAMKPNYNKVKWSKNSRYLHAWETGTTGYPIVDAAMRQLNETGYMHNRARLIVASFLVKTLLIDWREGEEYFATKLTDYDPASNNGNWQWIAGTGADSQPYFRIFNPWQQSENFDPDAIYIKHFIPELKDVPAKAIHNWENTYSEYKNVHYPKPIVDYSKQKDLALKMYSSVFH